MSNFTGQNFVEYQIRNDWDPAKQGHIALEKDWKRTLTKMGADAQRFDKTATQALKRVEQAGSRASKKVNKVGVSAKAAGSSLVKAFASGAAGGTLLTAVIRKVVQGLSAMISKAMTISSGFETGLAEISTLLDAHLKPQIAAYEEALSSLSIHGDQSLKTLARATYDAISAGVTGFSEVTAAVKAADIAATAGLTTTGKAMSAFVRVRNAWKEDAGTFADISDVLFTTVKAAQTTFPQMASAIGNVAGTAAQAGLSLKETMAAFAAITKVTKNSNTSMTYLRNLIVAILKPTERSKKAFEELGISYGQAALQSKGLVGIMAQIKKATGGAAEQIAKIFPNQRAMQAAMTLAGRGLNTFRNSLDLMAHSAGAAGVAYKDMQATYKFASDQLKNITGHLLKQTFAPFYERIKQFVVSFNRWFLENKDTIMAWGRIFGVVIGKVIDGLVKVLSVINKLLTPAKWLFKWLTAPFVWMAKHANEMDAWRTQQAKNIAKVADESKKLNEVTKAYALVQQQILSGGVELNAAMEKLFTKMSKLNSAQRASILLATKARLYGVQEIIRLEQERERFIFERNKKEQIRMGHNIALLKKRWHLLGANLTYLRAEERLTEKFIGTLKKKSERITETGLAGIAARRFMVRSLSQEKKIEIRRQKDIQKIYALKRKDLVAYKKAVVAINIYWDRKLAELQKKNADKADKAAMGGRRLRVSKEVRDYMKRKAGLPEMVRKIGQGILGQDVRDTKAEKAAKQRMQDQVRAIGQAALAAQAKSNAEIGKAQTQFSSLTGTKNRATLYSIMFGTDAQIKQQHGKMLETLGKSTADLKSAIMSAFGNDTLARAAVWWGEFTKLGAKGAQAFTQQVEGTLGSLVSSLGSGWMKMFQDMVVGQKVSSEEMFANMLDFVSKTLLQLAVLTTGWALQWLGAQNYAAAAIAGAAAASLYALAGISAGGASLIRGSANSAATTGATAGGSLNSSRTSMPGTQGQQGSQTVVYNFRVSKEPWDSATDEDRNRAFENWGNKMARSRGGPPTMVRALDGRTFR